jgi:MoaA/NifB/PqqE/SkfB family radical SAM enzyme
MKLLLQKKYSDILQQPINQIYQELKAVNREVFADNERIVFIDDVADCPQKAHMVEYIKQILKHLDVDKFFVQTVNSGSKEIQNPTNYAIPDTICMTPWLSLEVDVDSKLHRCCLWDRKDGTTSDSIVEYFESSEQQKLKQDFLNGKQPDACYKCWQVESAGGISKRLNDNYVFRDHKFDIDYNDTATSKIVNLDIKLGNKCNLACRICSSRCSSTWSKFDSAVNVEFNWLDNESSNFWSDIIAVSGDVRYITFAGGEPLLDKTHRKLLQYFIDQNLSKDIVLHYNTNGTVFADFLFDYWDQFKTVELSFSIDAVGRRFEYERYGVPWNKVHDNLEKYKGTQYTCNFYTTVTALNVLYSDEIYRYSKQLGWDITYNLLSDPEDLAVTNLPDKVKLGIKDKLLASDLTGFKEKITPVISMMETKSSISSLHNYLAPQDVKRAQYFEDYYTELHSEITRCQ